MNLRRHGSHRQHRRRAISTVGLACMMPILLGFVALAVDVGFMHALESETQNAADSSAMAGAIALGESGMGAGSYTAAHDRAITFLHDNCFTHTSKPNTETVEVGRWDEATRTFTADVGPLNAVRVQVIRNDAPLFFANIFGMNKFDVAREAIACLKRPTPCLIWGITGAEMGGGGFTDAYDSTDGPYSALSASQQGNVCSCQDIEFTGGSYIQGDAYRGQGHSATFGGGGYVTGDTDYIKACWNGVMNYGNVATVNDNAQIGLTDDHKSPWKRPGELLVGSGDNLTVPPGTYYVDSFDFTGGATLTITGKTTFYVGTGRTNVGGGGVTNTTSDPHNFTIYCKASKVTWTGGSTFYGVFVAPNSDVVWGGGGDLMGSIVAGLLEGTGGSKFHADLSLLDPILPPVTSLVK